MQTSPAADCQVRSKRAWAKVNLFSSAVSRVGWSRKVLIIHRRRNKLKALYLGNAMLPTPNHCNARSRSRVAQARWKNKIPAGWKEGKNMGRVKLNKRWKNECDILFLWKKHLLLKIAELYQMRFWSPFGSSIDLKGCPPIHVSNPEVEKRDAS